MGKATFKAEVIGARGAADKMLRGSRQMRPVMFEELDRLAGRTTRIMRSVAPHRSGKLAGNIHPEIISSGFQLVSDVASEEGFHYTGVTRYGHQTAFIYPRRAKALRFTIGGRVIFAKRVRGYHPSRDWVEAGIPGSRAEASRSSERVGRRIVAVMS